MNKNYTLIKILYFALTVIVIAAPALLNRYPIVYFDSHNYIYQSGSLEAVKTNPIGYGLFIRAFSWQASLYPVIFAQALLYSLLLFFTIRSLKLFSKIYIVHFIAVIFLTLFTSMGYIASLIMADFFAPVLILSVYLLFARDTGLAIKIFAFVAIGFSGMTHFSTQLEIIVLFIALLIIWKLLSSYSLKQYLLRGSFLVLAFVMAVAINFAFDYTTFHDDEQGSIKHVIIMGRLVETGILDEYLEHNCEDSRYSLCEYKRQFPRRASEFVWNGDSPFYKTGGWNDSKEEYTEIIRNVFTSPYYLGMFAYKGLISGLKQLVMFKTGLIVVMPDSKMNRAISSRYYHEYKDFQRSKQRVGEQKLPYMNMIHYCLTGISVLLIIILFSGRRNLDPNLTNLIIIIVVGIFLNAMITGSIGGAIHRYQARVNWLLVLAGIIVAGYYLKQFIYYINKLDLPKKKD